MVDFPACAGLYQVQYATWLQDREDSRLVVLSGC
jgi:hypothetical protein